MSLTPEEQRELALDCDMAVSQGGNGYWDNVGQLATYTAAVEAKRDEEVAALKQELQALREQEPVGYFDEELNEFITLSEITDYGLKVCRKVYTTPMPVSEGMVLVPIEPTEEMLFEGIAYINNKTTVECMYRAMLAAAPKDKP